MRHSLSFPFLVGVPQKQRPSNGHKGSNYCFMKPSFSHVVCGAEEVQRAFDPCFAARLWWRAILWLHGKPTAPTLSVQQRTHVIAAGFRFYAQLYRFLSLVLAFVSVTALASSVYSSFGETIYWTGAGLGASLMLWSASGIGFAGAKSLRAGRCNGRLLLVAFMVAIIAFLSAFVAGLSVVIQTQNIGNVWLNFGATSALWLVGIGSYFIEVLYLVAEDRFEKASA